MKTIATMILLTGLVSLTGCATKPPTFGERILAEGESQIAISKMWEQGKKDTREGEALLKEGKKLLADGKDYSRKGEKLLANSSADLQTNRQAFKTLALSANNLNTSKAASDMVARLEKLTDAWEEAEEEVEEGNELLKRGKSAQEEGESAIKKGQQLITDGKNKIVEAEERYKQTSK
ncbi:hypothetical protein JAO78_012765 [Alishewanella sp. 16-MA]|uniref:Lipoprotein n=1 Tax=Alishewanella maricola TaxID=2795740 RepID=A0ABS8C5R2_9ALTE|nr:hypothetical protein [Alishewanella maricola]MCB5227684.1 hypothetical protein [Alishewanella maricola]